MCSGGWSVVKEKSKRVIYTWTPPDTEDGGDLKLTASQLDHTCALKFGWPTVEVAPEIAKKAVKPIEKMLSLS